ncbi:MAG: hypothetical protein NTU57_05720 [Candidatus Aenigmarchaeota archaeon]|nr:hypothetical protein [Candidatus Aenigmarchaeota archaeon]
MENASLEFNPRKDMFYDGTGLPSVKIENFDRISSKQKRQLRRAVKDFLVENATGGKRVSADTFSRFDEYNDMEFWNGGWFRNREHLADLERDTGNKAHLILHVPAKPGEDTAKIYGRFLKYARDRIVCQRPVDYSNDIQPKVDGDGYLILNRSWGSLTRKEKRRLKMDIKTYLKDNVSYGRVIIPWSHPDSACDFVDWHKGQGQVIADIKENDGTPELRFYFGNKLCGPFARGFLSYAQNR